jgi:hypothetical protein
MESLILLRRNRVVIRRVGFLGLDLKAIFRLFEIARSSD